MSALGQKAMSAETLSERIRAEAEIAARPGQYDRLNRVAEEVARMEAERDGLRSKINALTEDTP